MPRPILYPKGDKIEESLLRFKKEFMEKHKQLQQTHKESPNNYFVSPRLCGEKLLPITLDAKVVGCSQNYFY